MRNSNPKAKTFTAAQAAHMEAAEKCNIRARIIELGVKDFLAEASYSDATEAARDMLTEAVAMRKMARTHVAQAEDPQRGQRVPKQRVTRTERARRRATIPRSRPPRTSKTAGSRAESKASRAR